MPTVQEEKKRREVSWLICSAAITSQTCFLMMQVACRSLLVLAVSKQIQTFDNPRLEVVVVMSARL